MHGPERRRDSSSLLLVDEVAEIVSVAVERGTGVPPTFGLIPTHPSMHRRAAVRPLRAVPVLGLTAGVNDTQVFAAVVEPDTVDVVALESITVPKVEQVAMEVDRPLAVARDSDGPDRVAIRAPAPVVSRHGVIVLSVDE